MRSFLWWVPLQVTHEAHWVCISWFCYWWMIFWSTNSPIFQQFQNTYYLSHFLHAPAKTLPSWNHRENSLSLILTMMINDFFSQRQTGSDDKVHETTELSFVRREPRARIKDYMTNYKCQGRIWLARRWGRILWKMQLCLQIRCKRDQSEAILHKLHVKWA